MRSFLAAILAALALAGGTSLPAEASIDIHLRETGFVGYSAMASPRRHERRVRAEFNDEDEARPVRRWRRDGRHWQRPRYAKPRHVRSASRTWRASRRSARAHRHAHPYAHEARRRTGRSLARIPVRRYPVRALPAGADFVTVASYYWQGQRTATGARFNPSAMTAAHRTLPFGTRVRVTHLGNGRSVTVRINDRGPYVRGRDIDLSRGAAGVIGMHRQGVARVKVTVLDR